MTRIAIGHPGQTNADAQEHVIDGTYPSRQGHEMALLIMEELPKLAALDHDRAVIRLGVLLDQKSGLQEQCKHMADAIQRLIKSSQSDRRYTGSHQPVFRAPLGDGELAVLLSGDIATHEQLDGLLAGVRAALVLWVGNQAEEGESK